MKNQSIKTLFSALVLLVTLTFTLAPITGFAQDRFPIGPDPRVTPGTTCANSSVRRYPEKIVYCNRNVDPSLKAEIIRDYDRQFGYKIQQMNRGDFKIDHFIPLSIGGSNDKENLWPQHRSVFKKTDELEQMLSEKISQGRIKQEEAIRVIREAKTNLGRVVELMHYVGTL